MRHSKREVIHERTNIIPIPIPIKKKSVPNENGYIPVNMNINMTNQYDLKLNAFDPSKSSPPNNFMSKLKLRMSIYEDEFSRSNGLIFIRE